MRRDGIILAGNALDAAEAATIAHWSVDFVYARGEPYRVASADRDLPICILRALSDHDAEDSRGSRSACIAGRTKTFLVVALDKDEAWVRRRMNE